MNTFSNRQTDSKSTEQPQSASTNTPIISLSISNQSNSATSNTSNLSTQTSIISTHPNDDSNISRNETTTTNSDSEPSKSISTPLCDVSIQKSEVSAQQDDVLEELKKIEKEDASGNVIFSQVVKSSGLIVSTDCRWSSPHNGDEATVTVIDIVHGKVIEVEHLMRCRDHILKEDMRKCEKEEFEEKSFQISGQQVTLRNKKRNFHGTSKKMEGVGVKRCFQRFSFFIVFKFFKLYSLKISFFSQILPGSYHFQTMFKNQD